MIAHLEDRAAALTAFGWTRREAEWLALVCLHSGVFFRSQHLAFIGRTNRALANRFIRRCRKVAVEQPWNGSRLRLCRNASRRLYRTLGAEHVRHRRAATPEVLLRRLLSLDYVLEHPHAPWLPTEDEKVNALVAAEIPKDVLPRRLYHGAVSAQVRYLPHKLPLALDAARATFVFVQAEDETESAVRMWGAQHAKLWARLAEAGRAVEVVVVGRDPDRLGAAGRMLDKWASKLAAAEAKPEAEAEMAAIRRAIAACDMTGPAGLRRHQRRPEAHGRSGHRRDRPAGGRGGTDLALGAGAAVPRGYAGRRPARGREPQRRRSLLP